jgi:hypothetical protein
LLLQIKSFIVARFPGAALFVEAAVNFPAMIGPL